MMVGGAVGLIAASSMGELTLWPESDLRAAAENAGFAVHNRRMASREAFRQRSEAAAATSIAQATMVSRRLLPVCVRVWACAGPPSPSAGCALQHGATRSWQLECTSGTRVRLGLATSG